KLCTSLNRPHAASDYRGVAPDAALGQQLQPAKGRADPDRTRGLGIHAVPDHTCLRSCPSAVEVRLALAPPGAARLDRVGGAGCAGTRATRERDDAGDAPFHSFLKRLDVR